MEDLFRFIGVTILMWFCYASGKWERRNSYDKGIEDARKEIDRAFKTSHNTYASKGDYAGAWHAVTFILQPREVPASPLSDLSPLELYELGKKITKEHLKDVELVRAKESKSPASGLDALLR